MKKDLVIFYENHVFLAIPVIISTFMRTSRSKRENKIWGSRGIIKIIVFRDMAQCISLGGTALAH